MTKAMLPGMHFEFLNRKTLFGYNDNICFDQTSKFNLAMINNKVA